MFRLFIIVLTLIEYIHGHSMMTCAIKSNGQCVGAVRNSGASLSSSNYRFDGTNPCQPEARGSLSTLESRFYGSCQGCGRLGQLTPGSQFTVEWKSRNHAVTNQNPRVVNVYLSPTPIQSGQNNDFTIAQFRSNLICSGPFINCGNGPNVDTVGDDVSCTLQCTIPNNAVNGIYSLLWVWDWTVNDGSIYQTCADIKIDSSVVAPTNPTTQNNPTTATTQNPTTRTTQNNPTTRTTQNNPTTQTTQNNPTTMQSKQTTQPPQPTGGSCSDPNYCISVCGEGNVVTCICKAGELSAICANSSASYFAPVMMLIGIIGLLIL